MQIELPNSPGIPVTITRGGKDPITGETLSEQMVVMTWDVIITDTDGEQITDTKTVSFLGP